MKDRVEKVEWRGKKLEQEEAPYAATYVQVTSWERERERDGLFSEIYDWEKSGSRWEFELEK